MTCNCNCTDNNTIEIVIGTTTLITFEFDESINGFTKAEFAIRKDYNVEPVVFKTITDLQGTSLDLEIAPVDTIDKFVFNNGKNSASYIWGLDLINENNGERFNVFPQTGNPAPLCIVFKHVVEE